jgi:hypothetical protein
MWSKFLLKITWEQITDNDVVWITQKECDFIHESASYKQLLGIAYNEELLQDVVYKSKYFI